MRARPRLRFSPRRAKTRQVACASGRISSSGNSRVEELGVVGHGAQAATDAPPRSRGGWRRSLCQVLAMKPRSWMLVRPQLLVLQPEKATLNLRPMSWVSGWPSRW